MKSFDCASFMALVLAIGVIGPAGAGWRHEWTSSKGMQMAAPQRSKL